MPLDTCIDIPQTYRFDFAQRYLQRSQDEVVDLIIDRRHYRVIPGQNGASLIEIEYSEDDGNPRICGRLMAGSAAVHEIRATIERIYLPNSGTSGGVPSEALAAKLMAQFRGLPVVQTLTPWEALVWAVLGQQINIGFAYRLKRAFVELFGETVEFNQRIFYSFPTVERVAALDHERDLRPIQFSRQKSRYIIAAANAVLDGSLDFGAIADLDDNAASAALQRQLGIGAWTAEYILLRGYGRLDVVPAGDAALKALIGQHLGFGRSASEAEVRKLAEAWSPRRGEIAFMLWFAKQNGFFDT